jgi:hypothetical protein
MAREGKKIHVIMREKHPLRGNVSGANGRDSQLAYRMPDALNLKAASNLLRTKRMMTTSLFGG